MAERAGFEPTVGLRPTHALQACLLDHSSTSPRRAIYYSLNGKKGGAAIVGEEAVAAERVGFEPTFRYNRGTAFRERHHEPLGHLSVAIL